LRHKVKPEAGRAVGGGSFTGPGSRFGVFAGLIEFRIVSALSQFEVTGTAVSRRG
jgi:hypothetical protein